MGKKIGISAYRQISDLGIPKESLDTYFLIYHEMINVQFTKASADYPSKIVDDITYNINKLKVIGWLKKEDAEGIIESLTFCMFCSSDDGRNMQKMIAKKNMSRRGAPRDFALSFLLLALAFDLRHYTDKPHYNLVLEILEQMKILSASSSLKADDLRKKDRSLNLLEVARSFHYASFFSDKIDELYKQFRDDYEKGTLNYGFLQALMEIIIKWEKEGMDIMNSKTLPAFI